MPNIIDLHARQILDSRGNPTIEVELYTEEFIGSAAVPSGASTGSHEALELRDNLQAYSGKGVGKAVENVLTLIRDALRGQDITDQAAIDARMLALDGTANKKKLGANAMLGVSLATSRAASAAHEMPLYAYLARISGNRVDTFSMPILFSNVINGGVHAGNDLMPQEFMIVPRGAKSSTQATRMVAETYHALKSILNKKYGSQATNVGDEGGFAPPLANAEEALKLLMHAVKEAGYEKKIFFAMDAAASEFYDAKTKKYEIEHGKKINAEQLANYWLALMQKYPLISLEDPFSEDDAKAWKHLMTLVANTPQKDFAAGIKPQIVGDDLTVTNPERIEWAIKEELCNALLLKVNQIGTLTQAIHAATLAYDAGWNVMVSHRSGETEDPFIADLAVGLACGQIKLGAPCRSDRTAKYNQLLRIAEEIDEAGKYASFIEPVKRE